MKYKLLYTQRAERDIRRLDSKIKERISKTLLRYKDDPLTYSENLINSCLGTYRFRVGDYRVIFDIEEYEIVVLRVSQSIF